MDEGREYGVLEVRKINGFCKPGLALALIILVNNSLSDVVYYCTKQNCTAGHYVVSNMHIFTIQILCNRYDSSTKNTKTSTLYWCAILVFLNVETSESHTGLVLPLVGPDKMFCFHVYCSKWKI